MSSNSKKNTFCLQHRQARNHLLSLCAATPIICHYQNYGCIVNNKTPSIQQSNKTHMDNFTVVFYSLKRVNNKLTQQCARKGNKWITVTTISNYNNNNNNGSKVVQHTPLKLCQNCPLLLPQSSNQHKDTEHTQNGDSINESQTRIQLTHTHHCICISVLTLCACMHTHACTPAHTQTLHTHKLFLSLFHFRCSHCLVLYVIVIIIIDAVFVFILLS